MKRHTLPLIIVSTLLSSCGADADAEKRQSSNTQNNSAESTLIQTGNGQASRGKNSADSNNTTQEISQDTTQDTALDITQNATQGSTGSESESYIPYLRKNHDHYSDYSNVGTYPIETVISGDQVYWDIQAKTDTDAAYLAKHIEFMSTVLNKDKIPHPWDKLFVLEAFFHDQITTEINIDGLRVSIYKTAANSCAFELVKAHANAVSVEFFAQGDTSVDHSSAADDILALEVCAEQRNDAEAFIAEHWEPR